VLDSVVMSGPTADDDAFRQFVDRHRAQCLWFLPRDYYPDTRAARIDALRLIEKHGDSRAFQEAARYRGSATPLVEWVQDSAYRFFPLVQHDELGLARRCRATRPRDDMRPASLDIRNLDAQQ
jgi:hypothetical protein